MDVEFYLAWLHARLDAARALPSDTLLLISVGAWLLVAMALLAWMRAARRLGALENENAGLAAEVATSRRALDSERKWRLIAEKVVVEATKPKCNLEPLPPRKLQELLERENLDPIQPATTEPIQETKPTNDLEPPTRKLDESIESETFDPIQPATKVKKEREDVTAAAGGLPSSPADRSPETASAASAAGAKKATPAKAKSARRAAKVAGLINRTIFE
jgi:hypothetical protein